AAEDKGEEEQGKRREDGRGGRGGARLTRGGNPVPGDGEAGTHGPILTSRGGAVAFPLLRSGGPIPLIPSPPRGCYAPGTSRPRSRQALGDPWFSRTPTEHRLRGEGAPVEGRSSCGVSPRSRPWS